MNNLFIYIFSYIIIFSSPLKNNNPVSEVWNIKKSSYLEINGETNLGNYSCVLDSYEWSESIQCLNNVELKKGIQSIKCNFNIPVNKFDCIVPLMTNDFKKSLKYKQFPFIIIELKEISKKLSDLEKSDDFMINANVLVTGIKKNSNIKFHVLEKNLEFIVIEGKTNLKFSDFCIEPPTKAFGAVKVKDNISIDFKIDLVKATKNLIVEN